MTLCHIYTKIAAVWHRVHVIYVTRIPYLFDIKEQHRVLNYYNKYNELYCITRDTTHNHLN